MSSICIAAIRIAHSVVNNTKFPRTTSYYVVALELKHQGHWDLLVACDDSRVVDAYEPHNVRPAIDKLFELYPAIKDKYHDYHAAPLIAEIA